MIRIISFDYDGVFLYYYNVNPVKVYTFLISSGYVERQNWK